MKIKTGDKVKILTGKDRGKEGVVVQVFPKVERIVVEGINLMTKHLKKRSNQPGQKIQFSAPIHVSNVKLVSQKSGKSGRVGYKIISAEGKTKKIRVIKTDGFVEDIE